MMNPVEDSSNAVAERARQCLKEMFRTSTTGIGSREDVVRRAIQGAIKDLEAELAIVTSERDRYRAAIFEIPDGAKTELNFAAEPVAPIGHVKRDGLVTSSGAASAANPAPSLADELQAAFEYGGYFTIGMVVVKNFDFIIAALRAAESDEAKRNAAFYNEAMRYGGYTVTQILKRAEARLKADGK